MCQAPTEQRAVAHRQQQPRAAEGGGGTDQRYHILAGPADGMALIETLPDVDAVIVTSDNEVRISSGLQGRVRLIKPPTNAP